MLLDYSNEFHTIKSSINEHEEELCSIKHEIEQLKSYSVSNPTISLTTIDKHENKISLDDNNEIDSLNRSNNEHENENLFLKQEIEQLESSIGPKANNIIIN